MFQTCKFSSSKYWEWVRVRERVLRLPLGLRFSKNELEKEINELIFIAIYNDKVIGGLQYQLENSSAKMRQVAILPAFQGKGIGRNLIAFSTDYIANIAIQSIYCHARLSAVSFYESLGYSPISDVFIEIGIPHLKMKKKI